MTDCGRILYCRCAYAKVVPLAARDQVLSDLAASGRDFEAVPDLCELSARKDPSLAGYAADAGLEVVACFPRAVRWLFDASGHPLHADATVHNMRTDEPAAIRERLGLGVDAASSAGGGA